MDMPNKGYGTSSQGVAKIYGDIAMLMGPDEATKNLKALSQFALNLSTIKGETFEEASKSLFSLVRAGDLLGKMVDPKAEHLDPERMKQFLDMSSSRHGNARQGWP